MYLITVEGGDGSGKGLATRVVADVMRREFPFISVEVTGEPRREHPLGRLAIDAVRTRKITPEQEAGLFAADRVDHSHGWILPRLEQGMAIVSERNIHSSLVYQGIVGGAGIERVAHMNSAALVPDLCIWVDCDPEVALNRIKSGTLRAHSNKEEYFETTELQRKIRDGYRNLLSGEKEMPVPFDMGAIIGPILNEGTEDEFRRELKGVIRRFLHSRPSPVNVDIEIVDRNLLRTLIRNSDGQATLEGLGLEPTSSKEHWLAGKAPWRVINESQKEHESIMESVEEGERVDVPHHVLSHSISSVIGTLSLMGSADIRELRSSLGPVRTVSERHTQTIVKYLHERLGWIHQHRSLIGREAPRSQLRDEYRAMGLLSVAIWPLKDAIVKWKRDNPGTHLRFSMGQIVKSGHYPASVDSVIERLKILGCGNDSSEIPEDPEALVKWWTAS
ncbi:dTMP kinase [Euryarchaeota archaeon]|nr:dTMP kinase [Euryarchaeota archaeon]|tara:strand:+ start:995 stop:2335 length:1341 start_codon:yes stop_codon:yes gene_type:complete